MVTSYLTIEKECEGQFKDRGSKFFAFAFPVSDENEVKEKLDTLRKKYHDARHHCYAWKLGANPGTSRSNDDGEPSNSAGKPIMNQIEQQSLTNVLVVVVRYFGGTLLGVGGLINAYKTATANCLGNARITKKNISVTYRIAFEYSDMNIVMKIIKDHELEAFDQSFDLSCSLKLKVNLKDSTAVEKKFSTIESCEIVRISEKL
jgi:uncharacterized YigZ family protein